MYFSPILLLQYDTNIIKIGQVVLKYYANTQISHKILSIVEKGKKFTNFTCFKTVYLFNGTSNGKTSKTKVVYFGNGNKTK